MIWVDESDEEMVEIRIVNSETFDPRFQTDIRKSLLNFLIFRVSFNYFLLINVI